MNGKNRIILCCIVFHFFFFFLYFYSFLFGHCSSRQHYIVWTNTFACSILFAISVYHWTACTLSFLNIFIVMFAFYSLSGTAYCASFVEIKRPNDWKRKKKKRKRVCVCETILRYGSQNKIDGIIVYKTSYITEGSLMDAVQSFSLHRTKNEWTQKKNQLKSYDGSTRPTACRFLMPLSLFLISHFNIFVNSPK